MSLLFNPYQLISYYVGVVAVAHAFEYYRRVTVKEFEETELRRSLAESQLQLLRSRLHPHFLFNTLHGISAMVTEKPDKAKDLILDLSDLLRESFNSEDSDLIELASEMDFVKKYLSLEKIRLAERLEVTIRVDDDVSDCLVPPMILQPLVENAITHGAAGLRAGGWIEIAVHRKSEHLQIIVKNPIGKNPRPGSGLGLSSAKTRLAHLYANQGSLTLSVMDESVAQLELNIPVLRGIPNSKE